MKTNSIGTGDNVPTDTQSQIRKLRSLVPKFANGNVLSMNKSFKKIIPLTESKIFEQRNKDYATLQDALSLVLKEIMIVRTRKAIQRSQSSCSSLKIIESFSMKAFASCQTPWASANSNPNNLAPLSSNTSPTTDLPIINPALE